MVQDNFWTDHEMPLLLQAQIFNCFYVSRVESAESFSAWIKAVICMIVE